ncbi:MAG: FxLYD domain-containing protein [Oscillospiraceae bacterium]
MKKARTLFLLLVVLTTTLALLTASGCSSSIDDPPKTAVNYYTTVMNYKPFTNMPDITVEQVLKRYMDEPNGGYSGSNGEYSVVVGGTIPSLQQKVTFHFTVTNDPDDTTQCFIDIDSAKINDNELDFDSTVDYLYELFSAYNAGCEDLSQWQGSDQSASPRIDTQISAHDRQIVEGEGFEWVEPISVVGGKITGVIKNVSGSSKGATIEFVLYDESGYQISTAIDMTSSIGNGKSWKFEAAMMDFDNKVRTYELVALHTF